MTPTAPTDLVIRPVTTADYDDVRRITCAAYLEAGYFQGPDHPYLRVLADVEHRAEHAEIWVAERESAVVASVATSAWARADSVSARAISKRVPETLWRARASWSTRSETC